MVEKATLVFFCILATAAFGEDVRLRDGQEYHNAKLLRVELDGIVISTRTNVIKIPFENLSDADRSRFDRRPKTLAPLSSVAESTPRPSHNYASPGFEVVLSKGLAVGSLEYTSPEQLAEKEKRVAEGLMLSASETQSRQNSVPKGGTLTVIIHGTTIYSTMTKNYTVIILDEHGGEILRKTGDRHIPTPSAHHWISSMIIDLPQPIARSVSVYVVNNNSGHREEYTVRRL
jgi:hypothetical protein